MLLDQLSTVFDFGGYEQLLMSALAGQNADEAGAIYGLRNAFLHSYGLVNEPPATMKDARRALLRHVFNLNVGGNTLVVFGDRSDVLTKALPDLSPTTIDLGRLGDLAELIVAETRSRHLVGSALPWAVNDVDEFVGLSFFHHLDTI